MRVRRFTPALPLRYWIAKIAESPGRPSISVEPGSNDTCKRFIIFHSQTRFLELRENPALLDLVTTGKRIAVL